MNAESPYSTALSTQEGPPRAIIRGEPLNVLPHDLYIPPDALEVILEAFAGPLDLLLYLIRRQNIDILDIPVAEVTRQYMNYIEIMQGLKLDLAGEYLLMAATLAEIKSRLLLPQSGAKEDGEEQDPRAELVRRLQEYERYKQAAEDLDALPRIGRDRFGVNLPLPARQVIRVAPQVSLEALLNGFSAVMHRMKLMSGHRIEREPVSIRQRMSDLLARLRGGTSKVFTALLEREEGREGVVISFLAVLELVRSGFGVITQPRLYGPLYIQAQGLTREDVDNPAMNSSGANSREEPDD